jgi:hypothetical protein
LTVSEYERTQVFRWFEERIGKERATTMMALLPPVGWGGVATRRDLELLEEKLGARIDRLDARVDARIDRLEAKIDVGLAELRTQLAESRAGLQRTFMTWMLASQTTVVATAGVLLAVFR